MRILLFTPLLLLTACNQAPPQADSVEEVAASENANEADGSSATSSASASNTVKYSCDDGKSVTAVYKNAEKKESKDGATTASSSSTVTLTIDGKSYTLSDAISASGARYSGKEGPTKGRFFTWWEKDGALWLEGPLDKFGDLEAEDIVARCKEKS